MLRIFERDPRGRPKALRAFSYPPRGDDKSFVQTPSRRLRLRRAPDGWLGLERHYGFEYSTAGEDRHAGRIVLLGNRLQAVAGPMPLTAAES